MTTTSVKKFFEIIAMKANRSVEGTRIMQEWTQHYFGKIVQFETDIEKFYLIIHNGKLRVCEGTYPAPDLTLKAATKTLIEVFTGRKRFGDAMKSWELILIGAGHEAFTLGRLITTVMMEV